MLCLTQLHWLKALEQIEIQASRPGVLMPTPQTALSYVCSWPKGQLQKDHFTLSDTEIISHQALQHAERNSACSIQMK